MRRIVLILALLASQTGCKTTANIAASYTEAEKGAISANIQMAF